jgi:hypothetical protein
MSFTFNQTPATDLDKLRVAIGDVRPDDGPAPDLSNLSNELLLYFLTEAGSVAGAAALACDHLAALWTPRPIFGPGELSTTHVDMYRKFKQAANDWRAIDATAGGLSGDETPPGSVVKVSAFNFMETAP